MPMKCLTDINSWEVLHLSHKFSQRVGQLQAGDIVQTVFTHFAQPGHLRASSDMKIHCFVHMVLCCQQDIR